MMGTRNKGNFLITGNEASQTVECDHRRSIFPITFPKSFLQRFCTKAALLLCHRQKGQRTMKKQSDTEQRKKPYVAKVELKMKLRQQIYCSADGVPLEVTSIGSGSSVPVAIARAVRLAFKHPAIKRKGPTYIGFEVVVLSRWLLHDVASASPQ
jgi:hypothetical protein